MGAGVRRLDARSLAARDVAALLDWQQRAPHADRAHPTVEHLMPLFVALGAAGDTADRPYAASLARDGFTGTGCVCVRLMRRNGWPACAMQGVPADPVPIAVAMPAKDAARLWGLKSAIQRIARDAQPQPSISTRALRLITALVTVHSPSTWRACAPTRSVPEGWPKRTASRSPPPAARFTRVPGIDAAVPIATAAVPIIAWCSLPIDNARTSRSTSPAAMRLAAGGRRSPAAGATNATFGVCWRVAACSMLLDQPHAYRAVRADRLEHRQRLACPR